VVVNSSLSLYLTLSLSYKELLHPFEINTTKSIKKNSYIKMSLFNYDGIIKTVSFIWKKFV